MQPVEVYNEVAEKVMDSFEGQRKSGGFSTQKAHQVEYQNPIIYILLLAQVLSFVLSLSQL